MKTKEPGIISDARLLSWDDRLATTKAQGKQTNPETAGAFSRNVEGRRRKDTALSALNVP